MKPRLFEPHPRPRVESGFTLVELVVTLTVLVITLSLAAPAFSAFVANNQLAAAKSEFASSLALARSEAARSGSMVFVQAAAGGAAGDEFAGGWNLVVDVDGDGVADNNDTVLRHYDAPPATIRLAGAATLRFSASGNLSPAVAVSYSVCRSDGSAAGYRIDVAPGGTSFVSAITSCGA